MAFDTLITELEGALHHRGDFLSATCMSDVMNCTCCKRHQPATINSFSIIMLQQLQGIPFAAQLGTYRLHRPS
jgi:hypothetical protein